MTSPLRTVLEAACAAEGCSLKDHERVDTFNDRIQGLIGGIRLPEPPALPEAELRDEGQALVVSSDWSWAEQTRALKARKTYGDGGDA